MSNDGNRNAPCPCGSGKKYKNCCLLKGAKSGTKKRSSLATILILLVAFASGAAVMNMFSGDKESTTSYSSEKYPNAGAPQPPGPVPVGKVWSVEHGHWHNAGSNEEPASQPQAAAAQERKNVPQPPGPAPAGKEWSEEHGHWHNIPGYVSEPVVVQGDTILSDSTDAEEPEETEEMVHEAEADLPVDFEEAQDVADDAQ